MAHVLSDQEICERYQKSKDKKFEVMLMAEIEEKTQDEIIAILKKNHVIVDDPKKPGRPKKAQEDNKNAQVDNKKAQEDNKKAQADNKKADIPEIVFTLVADNLEKVSKDIQTEEVKLSELYKQQKDMLGFLKDNGILKQPDEQIVKE
jgi:hypothetical protein